MQAIEGFLALMEKGGFVMWPLLSLSVLSLALSVERAVFWSRVAGPAARQRVNRLMEDLRRGRRDEVVRMCEGSPQPEMMVALRMAIDGADDGVAMAAAELQRHRLERFSVVLSTIITASPMVGILGTVIGIIKSFQVLGTQTQLADPRGVSGGIGEALITTASGLAVALITLFPYMAFKGLADRAMGRMESVIAAAQTGLPRRPVLDEPPRAAAAVITPAAPAATQ
ncbi:MAG: Biopolymer transport protein ExbB [Planctomycetota bacterium]|jgi:biopolymer transport protein ExbB